MPSFPFVRPALVEGRSEGGEGCAPEVAVLHTHTLRVCDSVQLASSGILGGAI